MNPDPDLALAAIAAGMREPEARKLAGKPRIPDDERKEAARRAGSLARRAPHLVRMPEPLPEDRWHEYGEYVAAGLLPSVAARTLGVNPLEVYLARTTNEAFARLEAACEAIAAEQVESALLEAALSGDVKAQLAILTNRSPDRWKQDNKAAVTVNVAVDPGQARERLDAIRAEMSGGVIDVD